MGGEDDPMHPIESQADLAAALPPHLVQFEKFTDCGHGEVTDAPERAMALLRELILRRWINLLLSFVNKCEHPLGLQA